MKKIRGCTQKIINLLLVVTLLVTMCNIQGFQTIKAEEMNINAVFTEELAVDQQSTIVTLTIKPKIDQTIEKITLPDGSVKEQGAIKVNDEGHLLVDYMATKNDDYSFVVDYIQTTSVSEATETVVTTEPEPIKTEEKKQESHSYKVSTIKPLVVETTTPTTKVEESEPKPTDSITLEEPKTSDKNEIKLNAEFTEVLATDKLSTIITLTINPKGNQSIDKITLPDGTSKEGEAIKVGETGQQTVDYVATKNADYSFIIDYTETEATVETTLPTLPVESSDTNKKVKKQETLTVKVSTISTSALRSTKPLLKSTAGEDYVAGTGEVSNVKLVLKNPVDTTTPINSGKIVNFDTQITLNSKGAVTTPTTSVWVGIRLTVPKTSVSGGTWTITNYTNWIMDSTDPTKIAKVQEIGSNYVLEGRVLLEDTGNPVIPASASWNVFVQNTGGVRGDLFEPTVEAWLYTDGEANKKQATTTVQVNSTPVFNMAVGQNNANTISGYLNTKTGDFSILKPTDMTDRVYGRISLSGAVVSSYTGGNEKLDPTQPVSWDTYYKIIKKVGGVEIEETTPQFQPILLGVKRNSNKIIKSELSGSLVNDLSLGGQLFLEGWNPGVAYLDEGEYNFSHDLAARKISLSCLLSKDNKASGLNAVSDTAVFFVPLDATDTEDTERILVVERTNLKGKSFSGEDIIDANATDNISYTTILKGLSNSEVLTPDVLKRGIEVGLSSVMSKNSEGFISFYINQRQGSSIVDLNINSFNFLIKFEDGFEFKPWSYWETSNYSGKGTVLYATKPDGSGWTDETEMNYTEDHQLVYFDTMEEAKKHGVVVGQLLELREGIWKATKIGANIPFVLTGDSGKSYAAVQDIKIWNGDKSLSASDSYKGTNGAPVSQFATEPTLFMNPHDNPANSGGIYRRSVWNDTLGFPEDRDSVEFGDTVFCLGGSISRIPEKTTVLNGGDKKLTLGDWNSSWPTATYDIGKNERIADYRYTVNVSGVGNTPIHLKLELDNPSSMDGNARKLKQVGDAYLSTPSNPVIYVPNASAGKQGMFQGGTKIDPASFTVPGDGEYSIYYTYKIGDTLDIANDVIVGKTWWIHSSITVYPESKAFVMLESNPGSAFAIQVAETKVEGITKVAMSNGAKDQVGYYLTQQAKATSIANNFLIDVLPFNADGRGTNFNGTYKLTNDQIQLKVSNASAAPTSALKVYYTTDTAVRTAGAGGTIAKSDLFVGLNATSLADTFNTSGITWKLATDNKDNTWSTLNNEVPTAVVSCGTLELYDRAILTIQLDLLNQKFGDIYVNTASTSSDTFTTPIVSSPAGSTVSARKIDGTAWIDTNDNHLYDVGVDTLFSGVNVKLFNSKNEEIVSDANGNSYGISVTDPNGKYEFKNVPFAEDGYYVTYERSNFKTDYMTVNQYMSGATLPYENALDSDVKPVLENNLLKSAQSDVFHMKSDDELVNSGIGVQSIEVDSGFTAIVPAFNFIAKKTDVRVKVGASLDEIKAAISASAKLNVGTTEIDFSDQIDWSLLNGFDTNVEENSVTGLIQAINPINAMPEKIEVKVTVTKKVTIETKSHWLVVGDNINLLKDVVIKDGDGNNVAVTEGMIIKNNVPMSSGKVTNRGTYLITFSYTDSYGNTATNESYIAVYGELEFGPENRIDLIEADEFFNIKQPIEVSFLDQYGVRIERVGSYETPIDQSLVGEYAVRYTAQHPVNKKIYSTAQSYRVHGKMQLEMPANKTVKVNTNVNIKDGASAKYRHVYDGGRIADMNVDVTSTLADTITSGLPTTITVPLTAEVKIGEEMNTATNSYTVTFNGLPEIKLSNDHVFIPVGATVDEIKTIINATASVQLGDGSPLTDLTALIDYSTLTAVDTSKPDRWYEIDLKVKDSDNYLVYKSVELTIKDAVVMNLPTVNQVVKESFDPLKNVTAFDITGKPIDLKDITITNNVDINNIGNYEVIYAYTDALGKTYTKSNIVHIHGETVFEPVERLDLIESKGNRAAVEVPNAYYMNSDGNKVELTVVGDSTVSLNDVMRKELVYSVSHPINNRLETQTKMVYVHGDIQVRPLGKSVSGKVNTTIDLSTKIKATFDFVNDDGKITTVNIPVSSQLVSSDKIGFVSEEVNCTVNVTDKLTNSKKIAVAVGFNGLANIDAANTINYKGKAPSKEAIIAQMNATARMIRADGTIVNLTDQIDYSNLNTANLNKSGQYDVTLKVTDEDNDTASTVVRLNLDIDVERPIDPTQTATPEPTPTTTPMPSPTPVTPKATPIVPVEKKKEEEYIVVVSRDIPLSKTKDGISEELLKDFITATSGNEIKNFEIVSSSVETKVGSYETTIRLENGSLYTVGMDVIDDETRDTIRPEYGIEKTCTIEWILLSSLIVYGAYAIFVILKRREENSDLEKRIKGGKK